MRSYSSSKQYGGSSDKHTQYSSDDESAARTRPFSFDDIMLRRKNKRSVADVEVGAREARNSLGREGVAKDITDNRETEGHFRHNKGSSHSLKNQSSEDLAKISSRRIKEKTLLDNMVVRRSDKDNFDSGLKLGAKLKYDTNGKDRGLMNDRRNLDLGKNDQRLRNDIDNDSGKRHSRDKAAKDRHEDHGRESKRKYHNGDGDKNRDRDSAKKHDHGKRHDLEKRERKEAKVSSSSHYEEARWKRRQKINHDREHKRRRSVSTSPRAHRHSSKLERQKELTLDTHVKESGRWRSEGDGTGDFTNGSSSQFKRHSGSTSGLGGYSPRKRRTESAIRTPPPVQLPEKKNVGWDLLPAAKAGLFSGSLPSSFQPSNHTASSSISDLSSGVPFPPAMGKSLLGVSSNSLKTLKTATLDSVQLTQATRPMRRLYIENLPHSASEKAVIECLNSFLKSSGVKHIEGTQPCISCIINKDKGQALVEFLTPDYASAALSFDGSGFFGSILKIRRPKDFVDIVSGDVDKSVTAVNTIGDIVEDSPNKIFIAGISKAISPNMLRDIVTAFGPLKAYRFGINEELKKPCAFLEYVDQSVVPKACAGLNGMKIGGQILQVFPAVPFGSFLELDGCSPSYGIPDHVKPLLQQPTVVIKLNNVFNAEVLPTLSESDIDEILQDIRFDCARFGTVKSINVVKPCNTRVIAEEEFKNVDYDVEIKVEDKGISMLQISRDINDIVDDKTNVDKIPDDGRNSTEVMEDKLHKIGSNDAIGIEDIDCNELDRIPPEVPEQLRTPEYEVEIQGTKQAEMTETDENGLDDKLIRLDDLSTLDDNIEKQAVLIGLDTTLRVDSDTFEKSKEKDSDNNLASLFALGSVFVEYGRTEASCMAAHSLHGRMYDGQEISIEYVALEIYHKRFPK